MRSGGSKNKGSSFERKVCELLSVWVSHGKSKNLFWRSAISGGRATIGKKSGKDYRHQAGDICSVAPEGHALTGVYLIECKFYRDLQIDSFLIENKGNLARFWEQACKQAKDHNRSPMLIAKQNQKNPIVLTNRRNSFSNPVLQTFNGIMVHLLSDILKTEFIVAQKKGVERFRSKSPPKAAEPS